MRKVDEARLDSDLEYRFEYLAEFVGLGTDEIGAVHDAAQGLAPLIPELVDRIYEKLFSYDATKRHFLPRYDGFDGGTAPDLESLTLRHEQVQFRKQHLACYLAKLVTEPYDGKMAAYLDMVGRMHTEEAGSVDLHIPLIQMNALLGFVADAVFAAIHQLGLEPEVEFRTVRAFSKILWIQNDFINRHYAPGERSRGGRQEVAAGSSQT